MDPFHQDREVRRLAEERGITYMAYSSFGSQWAGGGGNPVLSDPTLREVSLLPPSALAPAAPRSPAPTTARSRASSCPG